VLGKRQASRPLLGKIASTLNRSIVSNVPIGGSMQHRRFTVFALSVAFVVLFPGGVPARASDQSAVMATVRGYVDGINTGDVKAEIAACASTASIIDEIPPHQWVGPTACADWASALATANKAAGITDQHVTLDAPMHVAVDADRAYVVLRADDLWKQEGKPMSEIGSIWTFVLKKVAAGWRITGWTWAQH
jgi:hypothetical protein